MAERGDIGDAGALQCEHLRVTVFTVEAVGGDSTSWWREVTSEEPADISTQPRKSELKVHGPFQGGILSLLIAPERIDWILGPDPERSGVEMGPASIGVFSDAIQSFLASIRVWLQHCPQISRLALGGAALLPVASREEGYRTLQEKLKTVKLDPVGSKDFAYQINRPRPSCSYGEDLKLTRLPKWPAAAYGTLRMTGVSLEAGTVRTTGAAVQYASRTEFDLSTPPFADFPGPLLADRLPGLLDELANLAVELVSQGDVP
jgi:hypothetical protein